MNEIFDLIDDVIRRIDLYKTQEFDAEKKRRLDKTVPDGLSNNEMLRISACVIAYSQNASSDRVRRVLDSGYFDNAFLNFNVEIVGQLNPCDIADIHWENIKGIYQVHKLFYIVSLARKINRMNRPLSEIFLKSEIPKRITNDQDIIEFWREFKKLQKDLKAEKIPFLRSTTTLLHLLLEIGYDCVKPDLTVLRAARKANIIGNPVSEKDLISMIQILQKYSISRQIRPSVIDLYFLIEGKQKDAAKYVDSEFYE